MFDAIDEVQRVKADTPAQSVVPITVNLGWR
jgi:hypothetical protein